MDAKTKEYTVPSLPYLLISWFFCKIGETYRLAAEADSDMKLVGMIKTIGPVFGTIVLSHDFDLLVDLIRAVVPQLVVYSKVRDVKKFRRDAKYGSTCWGTVKDTAPSVGSEFRNNVILVGTEFLTMNT